MVPGKGAAILAALASKPAAKKAKPEASSLAAPLSLLRSCLRSQQATWASLGLGATRALPTPAAQPAAASAAASPAAPPAAAPAAAPATGVRRFANEEVVVQLSAAQAAACAAPASGLDAVLQALSRPQRGLSVMDKTRIDWEGKKVEAPAMAEELKEHVRSADTFVGKQAFLAKASEAEAFLERGKPRPAD